MTFILILTSLIKFYDKIDAKNWPSFTRIWRQLNVYVPSPSSTSYEFI